MGFEEPGSSSKTPFVFTGPTFFEVLEALGIGHKKASIESPWCDMFHDDYHRCFRIRFLESAQASSDEYIMFQVIQSDLFGMVKWPFQGG